MGGTMRAFVAPMRFLRGKSDIRTDRAQGNPGKRFQYAASMHVKNSRNDENI
jgi:hypothetical protein